MGEVIAIQEKIERETTTALQKAEALAVVSNEDYVEAGTTRKWLVDLAKQIAETFDPIVSKAHAAHKEAVAQKKKHLDPVEQAGRIIKKKMLEWDAEQERIRREAEARLQAEAQRQAEEAALLAAEQAEASGQRDMAEVIIETPVEAAPVVLPKQTPKVEGFVARTVWKFRIVDAEQIPREYLVIDEKKIGGVVRAMRGSVTIPGIEAYSEKC